MRIVNKLELFDHLHYDKFDNQSRCNQQDCRYYGTTFSRLSDVAQPFFMRHGEIRSPLITSVEIR